MIRSTPQLDVESAASATRPEFPTTTQNYATYFDSNYLTRGLALYHSLCQHAKPFTLWVLCLDDLAAQNLGRLQLPEIRCVTLSELEQADPELPAVKASRQLTEYYWTCGPAWLLYLLNRPERIEQITYLDADLYFFSSPTPLFQELGSNSILIIEHRTGPRDKSDTRPRHRFNVGLVIFRRSAEGLACLRRWREQCLEWCFDRNEKDRFGDQAYLTEWPERYSGVTVVQHLGAGVAPWNMRNHPIRYRQRQVHVGDSPVIFYHFSGLRRLNRHLFELHVWRFHLHWMDFALRRQIYAPYLRALALAENLLAQVGYQHHERGYERRSASWRNSRKKLIADSGAAPWIKYQRFMIRIGRWVF